MQNTSQQWKNIVAGGNFAVGARIVVGSSTYTRISAPQVLRPMTSGPLTVGDCLSACLTVSILGSAIIPKSAELQLQIRVSGEAGLSEWLTAGTFFVSRRERDPINNAIIITAYDAGLKANAPIGTITAPTTAKGWIDLAAAAFGVTVDTRTWDIIPTTGDMQVPYRAEGQWREILGVIAKAYFGNWVITPENKLRFVSVLGVTGTEGVNVPAVLDRIRVGDRSQPGLRATNGSTVFEYAGGGLYTIDAGDCPVMTQELFDAAWTRLQGQQYQPHEIAGAIVDPALEVGDPLSRTGLSGAVASEIISTYAVAYRAELGSQFPAEAEDEYPYLSVAEAAKEASQQAQTTAQTALNRASRRFGTSTTAAATAAKTVTCPGFELFEGAEIAVIFAYGNTAADPTLNVNGTGAKPIQVKGAAPSGSSNWYNRQLVFFVYDGANWLMDASDQTEVFNRLTNNGTAEGIYLEEGKLYINASYIQSGVINADLITAGTLSAIDITGVNISGSTIVSESSDGLVDVTIADGKVVTNFRAAPPQSYSGLSSLDAAELRVGEISPGDGFAGRVLTYALYLEKWGLGQTGEAYPAIMVDDRYLDLTINGVRKLISLTPTVASLTAGTGVTVSVQNVRSLNGVTYASGVLNLTAQAAANAVLASGFPVPVGRCDLGLIGSGSAYRAQLNTSGQLVAGGTVPAGFYNFNITYLEG